MLEEGLMLPWQMVRMFIVLYGNNWWLFLCSKVKCILESRDQIRLCHLVPGMVVHDCNPRYQEEEIGRSWSEANPGKVSRDPIQSGLKARGLGVWVCEWCVRALTVLNSIPSATQKKSTFNIKTSYFSYHHRCRLGDSEFIAWLLESILSCVHCVQCFPWECQETTNLTLNWWTLAANLAIPA
jgi:hypothetical protein